MHNKERPKGVVENAGSEATGRGENIEAISPHEKYQEVEVAIAREDMHSRSKTVKVNITYRCYVDTKSQ